MISILNSGSTPQLLGQLRDWFELEWGKPVRLDEDDALPGLPVPLVAVEDGSLLVGGIAFTGHPKPDSCEPGVWINA